MAQKPKPQVSKPVFDEEMVLRFAARAASGADRAPPTGPAATERTSITLQLKPEIISLLTAEADRRGKSVDQVVAKLVSKHLGKQ